MLEFNMFKAGRRKPLFILRLAAITGVEMASLCTVFFTLERLIWLSSELSVQPSKELLKQL